MITQHDLQEAIAECKGERNPNANTCIKLAAFLTIQRELYGEKELPSYSYDPPEIGYVSDTEFAQAIERKNADEVWAIMDELMTTLQVVEPRLYNAVMRKLND